MKKDVSLFIDEESYQQIKKIMCKKDDYFTKKEIENFNMPSLNGNNVKKFKILQFSTASDKKK